MRFACGPTKARIQTHTVITDLTIISILHVAYAVTRTFRASPINNETRIGPK